MNRQCAPVTSSSLNPLPTEPWPRGDGARPADHSATSVYKTTSGERILTSTSAKRVPAARHRLSRVPLGPAATASAEGRRGRLRGQGVLPGAAPADPGGAVSSSGPAASTCTGSGARSGSWPTLCSSSRQFPDRLPRTDHEQLPSGPRTLVRSGRPSSREMPRLIAAPWLTSTASDPSTLSAIRWNVAVGPVGDGADRLPVRRVPLRVCLRVTLADLVVGQSLPGAAAALPQVLVELHGQPGELAQVRGGLGRAGRGRRKRSRPGTWRPGNGRRHAPARARSRPARCRCGPGTAARRSMPSARAARARASASDPRRDPARRPRRADGARGRAGRQDPAPGSARPPCAALPVEPGDPGRRAPPAMAGSGSGIRGQSFQSRSSA